MDPAALDPLPFILGEDPHTVGAQPRRTSLLAYRRHRRAYRRRRLLPPKRVILGEGLDALRLLLAPLAFHRTLLPHYGINVNYSSLLQTK